MFIRTASAQLFHEFTATIDIVTMIPTPAEVAEAVWTYPDRTLT
jgi:hypothetical protein